jgi:hypothetical protein
MTAFVKKNLNLHILSLIIFSIYYLISLIIFESVAIRPHDNLDIEPVLDHVILRLLKGDLNSYQVFLSGEFKWYYLDRIFYPINFFHIFLSDKQFYFFKEIIEKVIAYFSFYLLGKYLIKNKVYSIFGALLYATLVNDINYPSPTIFLPIMPYLLYLLTSKSQLKLKHYFVIFLIGLNSSLVFDYLPAIIIAILSYFMMHQKNYKILFSFFILISLSMAISGVPLLLSIFGEPLHRAAMEKQGIIDIIITEFRFISEMFSPNRFKEFFYLPVFFLKIILLASCFFINDKKIYFFLLSIVLIFLFKTLLTSNISQIIFNYVFLFLKGFNFSRIGNVLPLLFSIILVLTLNSRKNKWFTKTLIFLTIISSISFQLYYPVREFTKEFLKKNLKEDSLRLVKENYTKLGTRELISMALDKKNFIYENFIFDLKTENSFDNYYKFNIYKKIKKLVNDSRVASVGVDPMIAAMNDINIIDGYHYIYQLSYKNKFRKIIEEELNKNGKLKDYYDNWGNRVYMFYNDQNNLLLNFNEAKNLGAEYIISSFPVQNKNIESNYLLHDEKNNIYLYKII